MQQMFRQTWQLIKQNRLFSGVYMVGTALAIAMVMAYSIVWYVAIADIAPENHRSRCLYMGYLAELYDSGGLSSSSMTVKCIENVIPEEMLGQEIEAVAIKSAWREDAKVFSDWLPDGISVPAVYASADICRVFEYAFLQGGPFTAEDVTAKARKVFMTQGCARRLFGTEEAVGRQFLHNQKEYTVCGVIRNVSGLSDKSYSNIWFPISLSSSYDGDGMGDTRMLGDFSAVILARFATDLDQIRAGIQGRMRQLNLTFKEMKLENYGQPDTHFNSIFREYSNQTPVVKGYVYKALFIVVILLLIPAVNLAGVIVSGLDARVEELGVRKAFGATRGRLMKLILIENFLLTTMGGVLGLVLSYLVTFFASSRIMTFINLSRDVYAGDPDPFLTRQMLFSPSIFLMAFLMCMVLNLLAASVPAYLCLRKNIVESLTVDKK